MSETGKFRIKWWRVAGLFGFVVVVAAINGEEKSTTATAAPATTSPARSMVQQTQVVDRGPGVINADTPGCENSDDLTVSSGRTGYCRDFKAGESVRVAGEGVGLYCIKSDDTSKCQWVPKHVVNFTGGSSVSSSLGPSRNWGSGSSSSSGSGGSDYPRMDLLDVVVNPSITTFETSGFMTVYDGIRASMTHNRRESATLAAVISELSSDLKKRLIQRCNFGKMCRVSVKGRRNRFGDSVTIEELSIQSSFSAF
jgi:hypothetical protein